MLHSDKNLLVSSDRADGRPEQQTHQHTRLQLYMCHCNKQDEDGASVSRRKNSSSNKKYNIPNYLHATRGDTSPPRSIVDNHFRNLNKIAMGSSIITATSKKNEDHRLNKFLCIQINDE